MIIGGMAENTRVLIITHVPVVYRQLTVFMNNLQNNLQYTSIELHCQRLSSFTNNGQCRSLPADYPHTYVVWLPLAYTVCLLSLST